MSLDVCVCVAPVSKNFLFSSNKNEFNEKMHCHPLSLHYSITPLLYVFISCLCAIIPVYGWLIELIFCCLCHVIQQTRTFTASYVHTTNNNNNCLCLHKIFKSCLCVRVCMSLYMHLLTYRITLHRSVFLVYWITSLSSSYIKKKKKQMKIILLSCDTMYLSDLFRWWRYFCVFNKINK